jgi:hypothetical protein
MRAFVPINGNKLTIYKFHLKVIDNILLSEIGLQANYLINIHFNFLIKKSTIIICNQ